MATRAGVHKQTYTNTQTDRQTDIDFSSWGRRLQATVQHHSTVKRHMIMVYRHMPPVDITSVLNNQATTKYTPLLAFCPSQSSKKQKR